MMLEDFENKARQLDAQDPLAGYRDQFVFADEDLLYLDGNSLGRMPNLTRNLLDELVDHQWGQRLIRSWGENWYQAPERIGDKIAALIGARPGEVIVGDSTTVNLFKLVICALSMRPERKTILSDVLNFPTDLYAIQGAIDMLGADHRLQLLPSPDEQSISMHAYEQALQADVALVTFSTPTFKSGFLHEIEQMTQMAHEAGALVIWDFSHAVGCVPLNVQDWNIDFAVGCCYKYLNGGPGAPAFLYARHAHQTEALAQPWGWWGHQSPFQFDLDFQPAESIRRFLVGTPPVLSMMAIEPGVDIVARAGVDAIRAKGLQLGALFVELFDQALATAGFALGSPRAAEQRGSHISIRHAESYRIYQALLERQSMITDFREPDNIRLGFAPLYTRYVDVVEAVRRLRAVVDLEQYQDYELIRASVT